MRFGPRFQVLRQLWIGDRELLAGYEHHEVDTVFEVHPVLLDAALQAGAPLGAVGARDLLFLPALIEQVRVWRRPSPSGLLHVRLRSETPPNPNAGT